MQLLRVIILLGILMTSGLAGAYAQDKEIRREEKPRLNELDSKGRKNGMWWTSQAASMGEPGITEFGSYDHGNKLGPWYKIDGSGDLISIESYRNNVLDGEVKYFDKGQLYCTGYYRGLNPDHEFDTIVVTDPVTQDETFKVIATDKGYMRHGTWRYYNPLTGQLIKEEEYQVDELVFKKEFETYSEDDSLAIRQRELQLPHNKKTRYVPPPSKRTSAYE